MNFWQIDQTEWTASCFDETPSKILESVKSSKSTITASESASSSLTNAFNPYCTTDVLLTYYFQKFFYARLCSFMSSSKQIWKIWIIWRILSAWPIVAIFFDMAFDYSNKNQHFSVCLFGAIWNFFVQRSIWQLALWKFHHWKAQIFVYKFHLGSGSPRAIPRPGKWW